MAKSKIRLVKSEAEAAPWSEEAAACRQAPDQAMGAAPKKRARSVAVRLSAEVDRLQAELAAARARVAQLEAKVHLDPLLEFLTGGASSASCNVRLPMCGVMAPRRP